ncbi:unnamed protein product [Effrenium voratum]|uniref:6-pyruvoyltetrahydropterin synthase n=1 Tax=Effrenium voratum TaxID=2562239 RepID=A0AA36IZA1_9DINO|nr:unnamed protein product [Effrenium voratum]CAJ1453014.1 unnamed protein product [Effrenium voratum]
MAMRKLGFAGLRGLRVDELPTQVRTCFCIGVQDRCMYSHTFHFRGVEPFTTGCTAVVEVKIFGRSLTEDQVLLDICAAQKLLRRIMERYDHQNLDRLEEFLSRNTTVEVMAQAIHDHFLDGLQQLHLAERGKGEAGLGHLSRVEVLVKESDVAFAGYSSNSVPFVE